MDTSGVATEESVPHIRGIRRIFRIFSQLLNRALDAEDVRRGRNASLTLLMRRLVSLDYVLEHPALPWLPTEPERVGAFETLNINRRLLPSRLYCDAAGSTKRYFRRSRSMSTARSSSKPIPPRYPDGAQHLGGRAQVPAGGARRAPPLRRGRRSRWSRRGVRSSLGNPALGERRWPKRGHR